MIKYNRQTMLRMINHETPLCTIYLQYCQEYEDQGIEGKEVENKALERLFKERIEKEELKYYTDKWNELKVEDDPTEEELLAKRLQIKPNFIPERPELKEIAKLINLFGWKKFMIALRDYAENQSKFMFLAGIESRQREWQKIADTIGGIRKNILE